MGDKDVLVLIKKYAEDEKDMILVIIYWILGYWAVGKTIYANKIIFGSLHNITLQRMGLGFFLGWILIPIAILKVIFFS